MHTKAIFTVVLSLLITRVLGAPVYTDSWLTTTAVKPINIQASAGQGSTVPRHASTRNMASSQLRVEASASNNAARFDKLRLGTAQFPANHKAIPTTGRFACPGPEKSETSFTLCNSASESPVHEDITGDDIYLHPDGKGGPDKKTVKKVRVGEEIGEGKFGTVYEVDHHELDYHGPLVVKKFDIPRSKETAKEIRNLRRLGQLHASGTYGVHQFAVMSKAKGVHLSETKAYADAVSSGPVARNAVVKQAQTMAGEAVLKAAKEHGIVHRDPHHGNVVYEVDDQGNLSKAHLIDWGQTSPTPKGRGPNGELTQAQENEIKADAANYFLFFFNKPQ